MTRDAVFVAKETALSALGLSQDEIGREQIYLRGDGSVEFFFSSPGGEDLAHIMVDSEGNARAL